MSARRRAKVVPLPKPAAEGASTEDELELSDLAGAVWLINCGVGTNGDTGKLFEALSHVERTLRRLSDQVGDTERRLGWAPRWRRVMAARYETRSGARTPKRPRATGLLETMAREIRAPLPPCPWPPEAFERLGGDLERIAGHLRWARVSAARVRRGPRASRRDGPRGEGAPELAVRGAPGCCGA